MKNYFLNYFTLSLIATFSFMSFAVAGTLTIKNDNIPDEEVDSRAARLVFDSSGSQDLYTLPYEGKSHDVDFASKTYERIFFANPGASKPICQKKYDKIYPNTSIEITVGYKDPIKDKVAYCTFKRTN